MLTNFAHMSSISQCAHRTWALITNYLRLGKLLLENAVLLWVHAMLLQCSFLLVAYIVSYIYIVCFLIQVKSRHHAYIYIYASRLAQESKSNSKPSH